MSPLTSRAARLTAALAALALLPAAAASAQDPVLDQMLALPSQTAMGHGAPSDGLAPLPAGDTGTLGATTVTGPQPVMQSVNPATQGTTPAPVQPVHPIVKRTPPRRNGTTCTAKHGSRTCLTYSKGLLVKRCVTRRHHRTCTRPKAGRHAHAASLGFFGTVDPMPQVGKIESVTASGLSSGCTGTIVGRSLVLTAAHCVYTLGAGYHQKISFFPAMQQSGSSYYEPYGRWDATRWWTPSGYRNGGDESLDFALIEIAPQNGVQIGDKLGYFGVAYGSAPWTTSRTYLVGYPASGWFLSGGRIGMTQYACDSTYDSSAHGGTGYVLWSPCYMNRGASGGPWFKQMSDGTWMVAGVTHTCSGNYIDASHYCDPYANQLSTAYFADNIVAFWKSVAAIRGTNL